MKSKLRASEVFGLIVIASALAGGSARADTLDDLVQQEAGSIAPGARRVGGFFHGAGEKTDWNIEMEVGQCYWIVGQGDNGVQELFLYIWDPAGDRMADNRDGKRKVNLVYCPPEAGMYKFQAKVSEGEGLYSVGVFAKPGTPMPKKKGGLVGLIGRIKAATTDDSSSLKCDGGQVGCKDRCVDLQSDQDHCGKCGHDCKKGEEVCRAGQCLDDTDVDALVLKEGKTAAPGFKLSGELFHGEDEMTDWYVEMKQGKCYVLVGAGVRKTKELYLYLWGPNQKRITENRNGHQKVTLAHCANEDGMYKFQAKVASGKGPYAVGVFEKK